MAQHVQQRRKDDCGICAVAMASESTYEVALAAVFPDHKNVVRLTWRTRPTDLRDGLRRLGLTPNSRITPISHWDIGYPSIAAVGDYHSSDFHWVYYIGGVVFDPSIEEPLAVEEYFYPPTGILLIRS